MATFYQLATLQTDEAIQNSELWAHTYPRDFTPHRILGFESAVLGKYERSAEEFRKAIDLDPSQSSSVRRSHVWLHGIESPG